MHARSIISLNISTLGLLAVTVADASIRKASIGGAANKPCSFPVLICSTSRPRFDFLVCCGRPTSPYGASWFSRSTPRWISSLTHSSSCNIPSPLHVLSSPLLGPVLDRQGRPTLLSTPARNWNIHRHVRILVITLLDASKVVSPSCHHTPHECLSLSTPLRASNSRSCHPVSLPPHVHLRVLRLFVRVLLVWPFTYLVIGRGCSLAPSHPISR